MTLRNKSDLDFTSIIFDNNEVKYRSHSESSVYLQIETRGKILCHVNGTIWVELPDRFADTIGRIDVEFVSRSSKSVCDYFSRVSGIKSSLVPSVRAKYVVCPVHIRTYTRHPGGNVPLVASTNVKILLSANYNKTGLIWNAVSIRPGQGQVEVEDDEADAPSSDINDILQECLLETERVEVIKI